MPLIPRNYQVLVKRDDVPNQTDSGLLYIPETSQAWRSNYGTVLAVGAKCDTVKVGDRVLLHLYGGVEIRFEGELVALFPEDHIEAVVDGHFVKLEGGDRV